MEILIILIVVIIVYFITKSSQIVKNNVNCKSHKWVEMKQPKEHKEDPEITYLWCSVCQKTPTEVINSTFSVDN
jgi:hypothetical protein